MRHMVVKDALQIAHRRLGGGEEDGLTEADDEDGDGRQKPEPSGAAESGGAGHYVAILSRKRVLKQGSGKIPSVAKATIQ